MSELGCEPHGHLKRTRLRIGYSSHGSGRKGVGWGGEEGRSGREEEERPIGGGREAAEDSERGRNAAGLWWKVCACGASEALENTRVCVSRLGMQRRGWRAVDHAAGPAPSAGMGSACVGPTVPSMALTASDWREERSAAESLHFTHASRHSETQSAVADEPLVNGASVAYKTTSPLGHSSACAACYPLGTADGHVGDSCRETPIVSIHSQPGPHFLAHSVLPLLRCPLLHRLPLLVPTGSWASRSSPTGR